MEASVAIDGERKVALIEGDRSSAFLHGVGERTRECRQSHDDQRRSDHEEPDHPPRDTRDFPGRDRRRRPLRGRVLHRSHAVDDLPRRGTACDGSGECVPHDPVGVCFPAGSLPRAPPARDRSDDSHAHRPGRRHVRDAVAGGRPVRGTAMLAPPDEPLRNTPAHERSNGPHRPSAVVLGADAWAASCGPRPFSDRRPARVGSRVRPRGWIPRSSHGARHRMRGSPPPCRR